MVSEHLEDEVSALVPHHEPCAVLKYPDRYCLNIKGIPYKTVWVEYPDIEGVLKKLGGGSSGRWAGGRVGVMAVRSWSCVLEAQEGSGSETLAV